MTVSVCAVDLTKRFGSFTAVDRVTFALEEGEIWGFLGPNGAGKSTTIRMLTGIMGATSGRAEILGYDVSREPESVKANIGYMSQKFSLWADLTVRENLEFYAGVYGLSPADAAASIDAWLDRVALGALQHRLAATLAGGWRQRLALLCAVLHRPRVLFLDEPTSGVDPSSRRDFWELIDQFADNGATVMVTTHYLDEVERCDRLAFINEGRIVAQGTPSEIRHLPTGGAVLEILCPHPLDAMPFLEALPGVREVTPFGVSVRVRVDSPGRATAIEGALNSAGRGPASVAAVLPSLEDVFVSLVEGRRS